MPGDLPALALRGPHAKRLVMVYLHGMCVYPGYYVESFRATAAARGDLVAVQGTGSCGGDGFLHTWSHDIDALDRRIDAALVAAGIAPPTEVVLIGYSQGADRAEALAARFPAKYRAVVLIASSKPPSPTRLKAVRVAALMAGTRDSPANMMEGLAALTRAHVRATFIPMPDAWHGHMGSNPEETMAAALTSSKRRLEVTLARDEPSHLERTLAWIRTDRRASKLQLVRGCPERSTFGGDDDVVTIARGREARPA